MLKQKIFCFTKLLLLFVLIISGCATENDSAEIIMPQCLGGDTAYCTCVTGETGIRVCQDMGQWLSCQCPKGVSPPYGPVDGAPQACALDEDADRNPEADVGQVTKTIEADFGMVPDGEAFSGDPSEDGPYDDIFTALVELPIVAETRLIGDMTIDVSEGIISGKTYFPQENDRPVDSPLPLVIVLAGWQAGSINYEDYSVHIAGYGFAVVGLDTHSNPLGASHFQEAIEISQAINWIIASLDSPLKGRIDTSKIALLGHSKGGKLTFIAAALDHRIDIAVALDPSNSGGPPCYIEALLSPIMPDLDCNAQPMAPNCATGESGFAHYMQAESLVIGVPRDDLYNPDKHHNAIHFYRGASSPAMLVYLDGRHTSQVPPLKTWLLPQEQVDLFSMLFGGFLDGLGGIFGIGDAEVIKITKAANMSLLLKRFKGMWGEDLDKWLPDNDTGVDHLLSHEIVIRAEAK